MTNMLVGNCAADGVIASNNERTTIRTPVLGGWHMLTVTTMQDGTPVRILSHHLPLHAGTCHLKCRLPPKNNPPKGPRPFPALEHTGHARIVVYDPCKGGCGGYWLPEACVMTHRLSMCE